MRSSRVPEKRGGFNKGILLSLGLAIVIAVVAIAYFTSGLNNSSAKGDAAQDSGKLMKNLGAANAEAAFGPPTIAAAPRPTPRPTVAVVVEPRKRDFPAYIPETGFGEALSEGLARLKLASDESADAWYTFQVDTSTRDITLFFALYDESWEILLSTVKIEGYTHGSPLEKAEATLYFPDGPPRVLTFDRKKGTITLAQQHRQLPYKPSLFSYPVRVGLVQQGLTLRDQSGDIELEFDLDPSGLSEGQGITLQLPAGKIVADAVFAEIQSLVDQIQTQRAQ